MILYRLASTKYIGDLSGIGARLFGGRWNREGTSCLYTSSSVSLALLEKIVHANDFKQLSNTSLSSIFLDDSLPVYEVEMKKLVTTWVSEIEYTQWLGKQIFEDSYYAAMVVPSVIVPQEKNWILNPRYENYDQIKIFREEIFEIDKRLMRWLS